MLWGVLIKVTKMRVVIVVDVMVLMKREIFSKQCFAL